MNMIERGATFYEGEMLGYLTKGEKKRLGWIISDESLPLPSSGEREKERESLKLPNNVILGV